MFQIRQASSSFDVFLPTRASLLVLIETATVFSLHPMTALQATEVFDNLVPHLQNLAAGSSYLQEPNGCCSKPRKRKAFYFVAGSCQSGIGFLGKEGKKGQKRRWPSLPKQPREHVRTSQACGHGLTLRSVKCLQPFLKGEKSCRTRIAPLFWPNGCWTFG